MQSIMRWIRRAVCLGMLCCLALFLPARAAERPMVRIGYLQLQGFLFQEENGQYSGIAYELLREIAAYNNWELSFFECGYSEVEQLFADDQIDLFVPFQKTAERLQTFDYSEEVFCTNKASLLTLADSPLAYDDFEALDGCTIGALEGTRNGDRFASNFAENGCHVTVNTGFVRRQELFDAVNSGEIDAFVSASNRGMTDYKIIAQLPQTDSYVIGPKGNRTYLNQVDQAISKINLEMPSLVYALEEKYQNTAEGCYPSLSREEKAYIADRKPVSVLVSAEECDKAGDFTGSAKVFFDSISQMTGLSFEPVVRTSTSQLMQDVLEGEADIIYAFNRDFDWADQHNVWLTTSYASFYNKLITRVGQTDIQMVSVVPGSYTAYWLAQKTDFQTVDCTSYAACIDAVLEGQADATYCNSPIGNYYSTFPKYSRLSFLTAFDMSSSYCMGVSRKNDRLLVDILNKSIACIPKSTLNRVYEVQMNSRAVTLSDLIYTNPVGAMLTALIAVTVTLLLIFTVFYLRRIKKKNALLAVANSAKTDFMSRMSHDMRTPMNGILGLAQLTREETDPEAIRSNLDQIELSGHVLLDLINDTLDMNKIDAGKLQLYPRPINSEEVFGNVITNANIMAAEKGVELKLTAPQIRHEEWVPVMADASRLEQVLFNIISNAVKFTPAGGTVELVMETLSVGDGVVKDRYIIRDSGIGMSAEFLPHLFDAFSQEKQESGRAITRDQGTGLGMSIVKQLVTLMGGEIEVKSELGKGTEVTLLMQYPICERVLSQERAQADVRVLRGKTILLCEDHPINAQIAIKLLEKQGVHVVAAENGEIGLQTFAASALDTFDCILMDIRMPVMDGLETTRAIRKLPRADARRVPIIAMTANAFDEDVNNCISAGMNDHLSKPFETEQLYRIIAGYLNTSQQP